MKISGNACLSLLALAAWEGKALAAGITASGKVVQLDGTPMAGVTVQLSQAGRTATTDAQGAWSMAPVTVGVPTGRTGALGEARRLRWENGRLQLLLDGHDISGRGQGSAVASAIPSRVAAPRTTGIGQDTLVYSFNQKVFLRDTISNLDTTGLLRVYDTTWNASIIYGELDDPRDGTRYRTVTIGNQTWMAENLKYAGADGLTGSCYYNDPDSCLKYGRLYRWATSLALDDSCNSKVCSTQVVSAMQGICPAGWHVPSLAEWYWLTDSTLGYGSEGAKLKSVAGWKTNVGTDIHGFRALPGGYRSSAGSYYQAGLESYWWSTTQYDPDGAYARVINANNLIVNLMIVPELNRLSLRCLRN